MVAEPAVRTAVPLFPYDRWTSADAIIDAMSEADRLGYFAVSFPEHFVMPVTEGAAPISAVWYDNFVLGASIAAATHDIRLMFNACVVPYRHPLELAKLAATLDVVSHGRLILVAGTGWMRREFRMLGIPYEERGPRTDDAIRAMKTLWTEPQPSYQGAYFSIPPVHFFPTCVQQPHVPIWIGGNGPRPFRRAVELGDGWIPLAGSLEEVMNSIGRLRELLEVAGRDPASFTFGFTLPHGERDPETRAASTHVAHGRRVAEPVTPSASETVEVIGQLRSAGANLLCLQFAWRDPAEYKETLENFKTEILSQLQP
jgi:probable F420-dependent oxidoreductase